MAHHVVAAAGSVLAYFKSKLRIGLGAPPGVPRDVCTDAASASDCTRDVFPGRFDGDEQAEQAAKLSAVIKGVKGFELDGLHQRLQEEAGSSLTPSHYVCVVTGQ